MESAKRYAVAKVVGFPVTGLRVRILGERDGGYDVISADLVDAGTRLWLSKEKILYHEGNGMETVTQHKNGLVWLQEA